MTYENLHLLNAIITNKIYLSRILKSGVMADQRRDMTDDAIGAVFQHMQTRRDRDKTTSKHPDWFGIKYSHSEDCLSLLGPKTMAILTQANNLMIPEWLANKLDAYQVTIQTEDDLDDFAFHELDFYDFEDSGVSYNTAKAYLNPLTNPFVRIIKDQEGSDGD